MIGSHAVYIRSKDGSIYKKADDYVTLHMLMTLNDVGSWNITSTAKEKCPFSAGDGIIDIRNGAFLYGGVVTQISDEFDAVTGLYNWSVQGKGDLEYLNRRLCYPQSQSAYYTESGYLSSVFCNLLNHNLGLNAPSERKEPIVKVKYTNIPDPPYVTIKLRYQNLLKSAVAIVTANGFNIKTGWDEAENKVVYEIYRGRDLTDSIVFTEQLNNIVASEYLASIPEGNAVLVGGTGKGINRQFASATNSNSINQWGRIEYYQDGRNDTAISDTANISVTEKSSDCIGYGCTASNDDNAPQFGTDYKLGDLVGMKVHDQFVTAEVQQVEINVSNGIETVEPRFGTVAVGKFRNIFRQLADLRKDVDELLGTEIE